MFKSRLLLSSTFLALSLSTTQAEKPVQISGIYPSLAMFNDEGECGTGAVVPWADRLWVITYAPHMPMGSSDKLYEITPDLKQIVRPESIGGTPANRMIHEESGQLVIGPHFINEAGEVRTIPYKTMFGRHTANARHLTDPENKIVYATMEEGIYEVDVKSLEVTELWGDEANKNSPRKSGLPGYHGKGFYSGQGVYVYSNNGERGNDAKTKPETPSGVLAEWDGKADEWTIIRRNQFTEVTGPGGIYGNPNPSTDPIWAVGWDYRSLILGVRMPDTGWSFYRLPKGSHSYDGAHGWNTEWPRIRDIGEDDLLMTMHGTFWRFPKNFTPATSAGIEPRSNYLKVIGDFTKWGDRIVFGCDDTAKNEFLNTRKAKGHVAAPQSQSNLWFVEPEQIDQLGPAIGRGAVWHKDAVKAGVPSDPYLFSGYDKRGLHLATEKKTTITMEVDEKGDGVWKKFKEVEVNGYRFIAFKPEDKGVWIRLTSDENLTEATAAFTYCSKYPDRDEERAQWSKFDGLSVVKDEPFSNQSIIGGTIRALDKNRRMLGFAPEREDPVDGVSPALITGYYELDENLELKKVEGHVNGNDFAQKNRMSQGVLLADYASIIYTDDDGKKWRLPYHQGRKRMIQHMDVIERMAKENQDAGINMGLWGGALHPMGKYRVIREVATERDLMHAAGIFYELPARNAGGVSKLRPVASHSYSIHDFCSYRGLWVLSGVSAKSNDSAHIVRSEDGKAALWVGAIDDIWELGKPVGSGGPWYNSEVNTGEASDPYLMTAFDKKSLLISTSEDTKVTIEVDLTGDGNWSTYKVMELKAKEETQYIFPDAFSAYWIRFAADKDCTATAILTYK